MNKTIRHIILFTASFILVAGAVAGGYYEANSIAQRITRKADERMAQKEQISEADLTGSDVSMEKSDGAVSADENGETFSDFKLSELICSIDVISGEIEDIVLHITDCIGKKTVFIYLEPECDYTMSQGLYRRLANGNVILPQTVRLSKLPEYYGENGREKAMGSLKRIVSELLGMEIDYYSLLSEPDFYSLFLVGSAGSSEKLCLNASKKQIFEKSPNGDSCVDYVNMMFGTSLTDFEMEKRLQYADVWNGMDSEDVFYGNVKMNEKNEGMSAEVDSGLENLLDFGR